MLRINKKIYHLCNDSAKVVFRNENDYLVAISRLAACAVATSTEVWAYSFMSTHFHLIVRTGDIARFVRLFRINIARHHNYRYLADIQVRIGYRELVNEGEVRTAVNYVLKNPIHHRIADVAFKYPYSSAHVYFMDKIYTDEYYAGEHVERKCLKPSELDSVVYRELFVRHEVPDSFRILGGRALMPESFVKVSIIENLYSNVRDFMFHMNKPLKEELEMFQEGGFGFNESKVSLFGKLTDIQVCGIVDRYIAPKPYTQITMEERAQLTGLLTRKGADKYQLERVL